MKTLQSHRLVTRFLKGFTLVEILIVIAILGVLAGLLFPVFARARESGRRASCASNLKQIGVAISLYASDNNQTYPSIEGPRAFCTWLNYIDPYVKNSQIFQCPSNRDENAEFRAGCPKSEEDTGPRILYNGSYDRNMLIPGSHFHSHNFRHPATTILVLDGDGMSVSPGAYEKFTGDPSGPVLDREWIVLRSVKLRHTVGGREGDNVLWADGHVKWLSLEAMFDRHLWRAEESDQAAQRERAKAGLAP